MSKTRLKMQRLKDESFKELVKKGEESKSNGGSKLQGVANYDILLNPIYQDQYAYVNCRIP